MGGQAMRAPVLAALFLVVTLATLAMPGSANFIGEFYILNGAFQSKIALAFVAAIGVALAAFYALRLYQRTMHNRLPEGVESREISLRDGARARAAGRLHRRAGALAGADPRPRRGIGGGERRGGRRGRGRDGLQRRHSNATVEPANTAVLCE